MESTYSGHRFPPEIIRHAIWICHRFPVSLRDVGDLLAKRGVTVSYAAIRCWRSKFGPTYDRSLRRKQGRFGDIRHVDEMFIPIRGERHCLTDRKDKLPNVRRFLRVRPPAGDPLSFREEAIG